jgi:predicted LPLAT superfamily acyltransferase
MLSYLRRALGREPTARDRMRLILSFSNTVHDRLWLLRERGERFEITLEGESVVREAVGSGGAFLMGAHMGSFEVLRLVGRRQGFTVAISIYEAQARKLNALLGALAPSEAMEIIPVGQLDSMLRIRAALEQGHLVGVLADRVFGSEPTLAVRFLGATAHFPMSPMRLAAILRGRAVFMLGLYRGANRYHVTFEPLADFSQVTAAQRPAAIEAAVQRYAQLLERRCRSDPYNWFNFFEFWPTTQPAIAAAVAPTTDPSP